MGRKSRVIQLQDGREWGRIGAGCVFQCIEIKRIFESYPAFTKLPDQFSTGLVPVDFSRKIPEILFSTGLTTTSLFLFFSLFKKKEGSDKLEMGKRHG